MRVAKNIIIAGKNNIAVDVTRFVLANFPELTLYVMVNKTDDGVDGFQKSFLKFSQDNNLRVINLEDCYELEETLFLSLEYDRLIQPALFKSARLVNIHFSYLPFYKGMYTSYWPIMNDEKRSGVTLHEIDAGIDTGDIIAQKWFDIGDEVTCRDLYLNYISHGTSLVEEYVERLLRGDYNTHMQPSERSSYFAKSSIDFSNIKVDLRQTAHGIKKQIRALTFREYQLAKIEGCPVFGCEILTSKSNEKTGTKITETNTYFVFSTIDYDLKIFKENAND